MKILIKGRGSKLYEKLVLKIYQKLGLKSMGNLRKNGYYEPKRGFVQYEINGLEIRGFFGSKKGICAIRTEQLKNRVFLELKD